MIRFLPLILILAACTAPSGAPDDSPRPTFREAPPAAVLSGPAAADAPRQPSGGASLARTQALGAMVAAQHTYTGLASWMPAKYGPDYLAMRIAKGTVVDICGPGGCWHDAVVMDYGPSGRLHPDRIADIAVGRWVEICGVDPSLGLCPVTVDVVRRVVPTLPPTDEEGAP